MSSALRFPCPLLVLLILACSRSESLTTVDLPDPPLARVEPAEVNEHGHSRIDNYRWLEDRESPEVIAYLEAENAYTEAAMAHTEALQERLLKEIQGRNQSTALSVPVQVGDYFYYTRYGEGEGLPIHARKKGSLDAPEEILVDVNKLAKDHPRVFVRREVSPGQNILAFAVDLAGSQRYDIRFKNLETGEVLEEVIPATRGFMAWAKDNRTLFYLRRDPYEVYRHVLDTNPSTDVRVLEDVDNGRFGLSKTQSGEYIRSYARGEIRLLPADQPFGEFINFPRPEPGSVVSVDHMGDYFYIRTNHEAENFRLFRTPVDNTEREYWEEVVPHRDNVLLQEFWLFRDHLVLLEREDGLPRIHVCSLGGDQEHYIDFGEAAYSVRPIDNLQSDTETLRFWYTSLTTPSSIYDYDMESHQRTLMQRSQVSGGFNPDDYVTERLEAPARDGVRVPVLLVYRKRLVRDGSHPLLLHGYGASAGNQDAEFSSQRLSLLDRGFVYAIAQVRGGRERGTWWYEGGRLLNKKNTFNDFIDVAEFLVEEGYTNPGRLFARGSSSGGLLVAAVANMRPELFKGVVALVPWLGVLSEETEELGNPQEEEYYRYILSYSPYDNVRPQAYPNLLVLIGFQDTAVPFYDPVKWVARLRAENTGGNRILLKTYMEGGHSIGGTELASLQYAFLLNLAGIGQ